MGGPARSGFSLLKHRMRPDKRPRALMILQEVPVEAEGLEHWQLAKVEE